MRTILTLTLLALLAVAALPAASAQAGFETEVAVSIAPFDGPLANATSHTTSATVTYRYPPGAFATGDTRVTLAVLDYPDWGHAVVEPDVLELDVPPAPSPGGGEATATVNLTLHLAESAPANATFTYAVVARAEQNDAMMPSEGNGSVEMSVLYVPPPPVNDTVEPEDDGFLPVPLSPAAPAAALLAAAIIQRKSRKYS